MTARQSIDGQQVLIAEAHARRIKIIDATVLPIKGSFYDAGDGEAVRDALNEWIRTSGEYDAVADLDRASVDPADPDKRIQARPPCGCPARSRRPRTRTRTPPSVDFSVHHGEFPFTTAPRSPGVVPQLPQALRGGVDPGRELTAGQAVALTGSGSCRVARCVGGFVLDRHNRSSRPPGGRTTAVQTSAHRSQNLSEVTGRVTG